MATTITTAGATAAPDHAGTSRLDRARPVLTAAAMVVAPWGFVVANAAYAWVQHQGGSDATGAQALDTYAAHPVLIRIAVTAVLVGGVLVVPAVLSLMQLARRSWSVFVGGSLMVVGYVCYFGVGATTVLEVAMADSGGPHDVLAAVIDAGESQRWSSWIFLLFVIGNLLGTLVLAVGLLRSRAVPRWAAVGILAWPVLHVTGLVAGSELFEVVGALAQAAGFAGAAATLLRNRSR